MSTAKNIILKLSGEVIARTSQGYDSGLLRSIIQQIKQLRPAYRFSLVIGGGNFFRGSAQATKLGISANTSHYVGMLATAMNGLIAQDICHHYGIPTTLFCALDCPAIGIPISNSTIADALDKQHCLIFSGGTGNSFFTTDTNAVLRALQLNADELWKATKVDGVYSKDPALYPDAKLLPTLTYAQALELNLGIMDATAFALAQQHALSMRIFNIFTHNALIAAADNPSFGSRINSVIAKPR